MDNKSAITFTYDGVDYTLEVTPTVLKKMQQSGVNFTKLAGNIESAETLWKGLFIAHHDNVPNRKRMEIYNALKRTEDDEEPELDDDGNPVDELMTAVSKLYAKAFDELKRPAGNVSWKMT